MVRKWIGIINKMKVRNLIKTEKCKNCEKQFESGIWLAPEFKDEKVLLFCSEKCKKEYLRMKLRRIKMKYPNHYEKIKTGKVKSIYNDVIEK